MTQEERQKDEKIRKALVKLFQDCGDTDIEFCNTGFSYQEIFAWLEKQRDKDKLIQELGEYKVKYTQEVLEKHINNMNNKDDERLRKTTIAFLKDFAEQGYENAVECIDRLEKQNSNVDNANKEYWRGYREGKQEILDKYAELEKQGEQKPNPYSGTSFEYNGHIWGMCARDNGVDILCDKHIIEHFETQDEQEVKSYRSSYK